MQGLLKANAAGRSSDDLANGAHNLSSIVVDRKRNLNREYSFLRRCVICGSRYRCHNASEPAVCGCRRVAS